MIVIVHIKLTMEDERVGWSDFVQTLVTSDGFTSQM